MEELVNKMKETLASVFSLYLKAHNFHWNVEGKMFVTLHGFFGDLYKDLWESVDHIAEEIRTLEAYAPGSLKRFSELTKIEDEENIPNALTMCSKLFNDNEKVIQILKETYELAEKNKACGLANFLQDRIDVHYKHRWMLKSITKE